MNAERLPTLLLRMEAMKNSLGQAEKKVVDYILENPEKVIYLSVAGLAESSGVSVATVVRACRKLGLSGYQDFKVTLAQDIVTPMQNIHEEITEDDDVSAIVDKVFQGTMQALSFTHDSLNMDSLIKAVDCITRARRVIILGMGNSHSVAVDLQHKLMRLGIDAAAFTDSHMQTIAVSLLTKEDVVFSISHSGSSKDVVSNTKLAKSNGAVTISLTSIGSSPLSKTTDIQLYTASKETQYRIVALSSRIAQEAIIDTLYTLIAVRDRRYVDGFHKIEKAIQRKKY
ncbi:MurR/RpiR family transcriptional regulator [Bacilliculturomica massiliensis]|uniref:MurR/RpiR family transcriptional regulator n=1 Tax=Bacilliculturomica massiliensis TaxID=1917867 RepID=UPI0010327A85|nr:MurR/RpiR family transcriptional regulator [Bacilliculturomica massiliensis]